MSKPMGASARALLFAAAMALGLVAVASPPAQSRQKSSDDVLNDATEKERLRQLQEIRTRRAELLRQVEDAERRLALIRAKRGLGPDGSVISWPEAVITAINSNWIRPPIEETGTTGCTASIVIDSTGEVMSIAFEPACSPTSLKHSIEHAIIKSSPLPLPGDPAQFTNRITARFVPRDEV